MTGATFDTGALLALERGNRTVRGLVRTLSRAGEVIRIPTGVLAQAWRADPRQHALHVLLVQPNVEVVPLDFRSAMECGALCGATGTSDVIEASVAVCARTHGDVVVTSDPHDIAALDPGLEIVAV